MTFPFMNNWNSGYSGNFGIPDYTNYFLNFPKFSFPTYMPMFQFRMPQFTFPTFQYNLPTYNYTPTPMATRTNNQELNPKQKAQIDEIRQMKYDSENLSAKLSENKDINTYAKYLTSGGFNVKNVINRDDGGKIYIYADAQGNLVGSVNKNAFGIVDNVALHTSDNGQISLNDHDHNGQVDNNPIISSKMESSDANKGKTFTDILAEILNDETNKGYTTSNEKLPNGNTQTIYTKDGKMIARAEQDKNGNLINVENFKSNGKTGTDYFFSDINNNGIIDDGEESIRHNIT